MKAAVLLEKYRFGSIRYFVIDSGPVAIRIFIAQGQAYSVLYEFGARDCDVSYNFSLKVTVSGLRTRGFAFIRYINLRLID